MTHTARNIFDYEVLPLFQERRGDYLALARAAARMLAHKNGTVTVDDVRAICPPPDGVDGRVCGAIFAGREFERVGFVNSQRKTCHGRPLSVFQLRVK